MIDSPTDTLTYNEHCKCLASLETRLEMESIEECMNNNRQMTTEEFMKIVIERQGFRFSP